MAVKIICSSCGATLRFGESVSVAKCACGHQVQVKAPESTPQGSSLARIVGAGVYPSHWLELHSYSLDVWSNGEAEQFFVDWKDRIPRFSCNCRSHFDELLLELSPDFTSHQNFAYRAWQWHDRVSVRLEKPRVSWAECQSLFGHPWSPNRLGVLPAVTAVSRLPKHRERQAACFDSWLAFGLEIHAVNTTEEVAELRSIYPQVSRWWTCDDVATEYDNPTQRIQRLARVAIDLDTVVLLINSDNELHGLQSRLLTRINDERVQLHCIRWNYPEHGIRLDASEFQWGIDAVSFTPKQAAAIQGDFPFAIGHAMWDYALPYVMLRSGFEVSLLHERLLYHEDHEQHWKQDAWDFGSRWLTDNSELDVTSEPASAMWRESLDPECFYSQTDRRWLRMVDRGLPQPSVLSYDQWLSQPARKKPYRKCDFANHQTAVKG